MSILIVSGIEGVRNCTEVVSDQLGMKVEFAEGRRSALDALRKREFAVVVVDGTLAECDPAAAEAIWDRSGLAIPLQINFALSGTTRIIREIRAALHRREREQSVAQRAATEAVQVEVRNTVSGLLLHSQLALAIDGMPQAATEKLRLVANLAGTLRELLSAPPCLADPGPTVSRR